MLRGSSSQACWRVLLGATTLLRYEHTSMAARQVFAATSSVLLGVVIVALPLGATYAPIYIILALYTGFFYSRRQAICQTTWALITLVVALFLSYTPPLALERTILFGGVLVGCAAAVIVFRASSRPSGRHGSDRRGQLDAFFQNAHDGFGVLDRDLRHQRVNQALAEIMGHERHEIEAAPWVSSHR